MRRLILTIAIIFTLIAFVSNISSADSGNLIGNYILNTIDIIGKHIYLFSIFFIIAALIVFKSIRLEKKHPKKHHAAIIATQTIFVFITGIFISLLMLLSIAIFELNTLSYFVNLNPKSLGIQTDIKEINNTLKNQHIPPIITSTNGDHFQELQAIAQATSGTDSFYGKYILYSIPSFLVIPTGQIGSTMFIDKTLIISSINKKELELITPTIAYLYIKDYFPDRQINHYPAYSIMNTNEYTAFRNNDYKDKLNILNKQIEQTQNLIASISATIQTEKNDITTNQNLVETTYSQKDKIYNKCMAEGYYIKSSGSAEFIHTNTKQYCLLQTTKFEEDVLTANNKVDTLTHKLEKDNQILKSYQSYITFFKAEKDLIGSLKTNIPLELGLFVPSNKINIVLNNNAPRGIANYFETVIHEYLHYASYVKNKNPFQVALFEEGLTEYFARNITKESFNSDSTLGYPVFVRIIAQITQLIPETELADYYFNKDQQGLITALNRVYGDNFYQDNLLLFETLQFTADNKQLLKFANELMVKLGGNKLKEQDLISSGNF